VVTNIWGTVFFWIDGKETGDGPVWHPLADDGEWYVLVNAEEWDDVRVAEALPSHDLVPEGLLESVTT
jgi:hypothetical protein